MGKRGSLYGELAADISTRSRFVHGLKSMMPGSPAGATGNGAGKDACPLVILADYVRLIGIPPIFKKG